MDGITSWFEYISSRWDLVFAGLSETLVYVVAVTIAAGLVAIVVGVATRHRPLSKELALAIASVFLTIPSLALFTIFIPLVGLGFVPSFIALFLYALLPILRNTTAGLDAVDPSIMESARGMGMTPWQTLWHVQLPMAWPVMLAGIRVSAMLTVGISAVATLVAGGGLGDFIKSGLARLPLPNSLEAIWTGVILSVLLALAIDASLLLVGRLTTPAGIRGRGRAA